MLRLPGLTLDRLPGLGFHLARLVQERTPLGPSLRTAHRGPVYRAADCFAYFLAFRYGLEFLLGIGMSNNVRPVVSITEYFDLFVNVTLGVGLVFELPVLIFLLTLLHILSPRFLLRHSRYAILIIVIVAAIITPTPDVFNLMLFAIPMCALYFVGVFLSYLIVLRREGQRFPWKPAIRIAIIMRVSTSRNLGPDDLFPSASAAAVALYHALGRPQRRSGIFARNSSTDEHRYSVDGR